MYPVLGDSLSIQYKPVTGSDFSALWISSNECSITRLRINQTFSVRLHLSVPFGYPGKSHVVEFLKFSYRNIIDPESEWNICKHNYFFCRHLNGSVDVHGPNILTDAESICQGMDY